MTKARLYCLACCDGRWRTMDNLETFRGADLSCLPYLVKRGLIEARKASLWNFRITAKGRKLLADRDAVNVRNSELRSAGRGGWYDCPNGHRYQGRNGCPECRGESRVRAPGYAHSAAVRRRYGE